MGFSCPLPFTGGRAFCCKPPTRHQERRQGTSRPLPAHPCPPAKETQHGASYGLSRSLPGIRYFDATNRPHFSLSPVLPLRIRSRVRGGRKIPVCGTLHRSRLHHADGPIHPPGQCRGVLVGIPRRGRLGRANHPTRREDGSGRRAPAVCPECTPQRSACGLRLHRIQKTETVGGASWHVK